MCWYNGFSGVEYVLNIFLAMLIMIYIYICINYIYIFITIIFIYNDMIMLIVRKILREFPRIFRCGGVSSTMTSSENV